MLNKKPIQLAVLIYGNAGQRVINLKQARFLASVLPSFSIKSYNFHLQKDRMRLVKDFENKKIDVVLKNAYGRGNETDLESFLDTHAISYFGSGVKSTLRGTSKKLSKLAFRKSGLPIVSDVVINRTQWAHGKLKFLNTITTKLNFPSIVKDSQGTDSRGIYITKNAKETERAINKVLKITKTVIVEKYIQGAYEVTCLVAGHRRLKAYEPVGIKFQGFLSPEIKDKWDLVFELPANIPQQQIRKIKQLSLRTHKALGCKSFSRTDFLVQGKNIYILETDVHPGFRKTSAGTLAINFEGSTLDKFFLDLYKTIK